MPFILSCANASSKCILLTHISPRFSVAVVVRAAEMVNMRSSVCPDDRTRGAMQPRRRFRSILVGNTGLPFASAIVSIRQAGPTSSFRSRGRPSTITGRSRTRISVGEAGVTSTIIACASRLRLSSAGTRPEVGKAGDTDATRRIGRLRGSPCWRRLIRTVVGVGQTRATSTLRGSGRGNGKRQCCKKRDNNWRFHCLSPAMEIGLYVRKDYNRASL